MTKYKENKNWLTVDSKLYTPIEQGIVMIDNTNNLSEIKREEVKAFYDFILSNRAKKIFTDYGYIAK